jgi:hypothetical protein
MRPLCGSLGNWGYSPCYQLYSAAERVAERKAPRLGVARAVCDETASLSAGRAEVAVR